MHMHELKWIVELETCWFLVSKLIFWIFSLEKNKKNSHFEVCWSLRNVLSVNFEKKES